MGCADISGFFSSNDPQDLPGQGLMRADNLNMSGVVAPEYNYAMESYYNSMPGMIGAQKSYDPLVTENRLTNLRTTLQGTDNVAGLPEQYRDAVNAVNPQAADIFSELGRQYSGDLALGGSLNENQTHQVEQSVRAGQAARGLGNGNSDVFQEMMAKTGYGDALRERRQMGAGNFATGERNFAAVPVQASLGFSPTAMDPTFMKSMLSSVYNQNQENNRATAANETQMSVAAMKEIMSMAGMAMGACWAAREVFGVANPQWLRFRAWLLTEAPARLRTWYLANGQAWAERLRLNPLAKQAVRRWMEKRINPITT